MTPLALPTTGPSQQKFEILRVDFGSPTTGGRLFAVTAGFPLWEAIWNLGFMGEARSDEWGAFLDDCRGPQRLLVGFDFARRFPRAYPNGFDGLERPDASPFDGAATSWSQDLDAETRCQLTLEGLPAGFTLARRDYVGFVWETWKRALVRCTAPATADEDGVITVPVEPVIPTVVPDDAVAYLNQPSCLMRLRTADTDPGQIDRRKSLPAKISALQDLIA